MAVKCKGCDFHLSDSDVKATCAEIQIKSASQDPLGTVINVWGNLTGDNLGQDILNRLKYKCPGCGRIKHWIGF